MAVFFNVRALTPQLTLEAYRALEHFVDSGQVRQLGVSNIYDTKELQWLIGEARVPVSVVQNRSVCFIRINYRLDSCV